MGANAQTTVPTFTASQVLTSDQQNQSARTGVPVFATTVTRDAAFGGTGEKTLAEGQLCYVEGTGLQTYNGTAWVTWGAAPSTGALVFISSTSFTTATSVSLPASTFTATYANYRVDLQLTALTADATFTMRMRAAGSDNTTSAYHTMFVGVDGAGVARNQTSGAATSMLFGELDAGAFGNDYTLTVDVKNPHSSSLPTTIMGQYQFVSTDISYRASRSGAAVFVGNTSFDSLSFISSVASSMTGVVRVYGYALS